MMMMRSEMSYGNDITKITEGREREREGENKSEQMNDWMNDTLDLLQQQWQKY